MRAHRLPSGFSIIELMVAVVIGLLAVLFATRMVITGELNKDTALGGSDAMQNGMLALYSLSDDASQAGWGLNDPLVAGCHTAFSDTGGYALAGASRGGTAITPLAAAVIQSNGANPDQISLYSGTSAAGAGSLRLLGNYAAGAGAVPTTTANAYGFNAGDVLVVAPDPAGGACALAQLSGFGGDGSQLVIAAGSAFRFNSGNGLPTSYTSNGAVVYNLGPAATLHFHTWSVNNGVLLLRATDLAGASAQPVSVTDNIVSIKAQYGFDTRLIANYDPAPDRNGMQLGQWSGTMVDADGDGVTGGPGDYQRVAALRLAVVARSKTAEKPNAAGQCTATTVLPVVFAAAAPASVAAVPVSVNVTVAGDTVNWKCYRYRVFETIVPVRNSQWRPS